MLGFLAGRSFGSRSNEDAYLNTFEIAEAALQKAGVPPALFGAAVQQCSMQTIEGLSSIPCARWDDCGSDVVFAASRNGRRDPGRLIAPQVVDVLVRAGFFLFLRSWGTSPDPTCAFVWLPVLQEPCLHCGDSCSSRG